MRKRILATSALIAGVVLAAGGFGTWLATLPSEVVAAPEPVPASETTAVLEALRPSDRARPVIAIVGINDATETTDYIVPTGILRRADVADVVMVATDPGPVQLYPALRVEPDATVSEFDAAHPGGADYVIVPAMSRDDDPTVLGWLKQQSAKGAKIIGVCAGAKVVAAAGLLDGKRATTHWYYLKDLLRRSPAIVYVPNRRFVMDGNVATTTGITASLPMMLTLIEAIAGHEKAEEVAGELGLERWDAQHASAAFTLTRPFAGTVLANTLAFWNRDNFGIALEPGMDEVSLAMAADAWSRTYRSKATTFGGTSIQSANGIRILPDRNVLKAITQRYGEGTADVVAMQLEYRR